MQVKNISFTTILDSEYNKCSVILFENWTYLNNYSLHEFDSDSNVLLLLIPLNIH